MTAPTLDLTTPVAGSTFQSWEMPSAQIARKRVINFAEAATANGTAFSQNNTIDIMPFYPGELVTNLVARVVVAGTAGSTVTVGDSANADDYIASLAVDGAANTETPMGGSYLFTQAGASTYAVTWVGGKFYTAKDALRLTLNSSTVAATGKIEFTAVILPVSYAAYPNTLRVTQ